MTAEPTATLPAPAGPPGPAAHARAQLIVGGLAGVALLSVFAGVVTLGVRRAESDHRAQAALHEATWRCNALRVRAERDACRCRLSPRPAASGPLCSEPPPTVPTPGSVPPAARSPRAGSSAGRRRNPRRPAVATHPNPAR